MTAQVFHLTLAYQPTPGSATSPLNALKALGVAIDLFVIARTIRIHGPQHAMIVRAWMDSENVSSL